MSRDDILARQRIVVTRPQNQAAGLVETIREYGADPVCIPTIRFAPPDDPEPVAHALGRLKEYDWVCFTSQNGVAFVARSLQRRGMDMRVFQSNRVAAVGPATRRALEETGVNVAFVPSPHLTRELGRQLPEAEDRCVLLLRAEVASPALTEALRARGARVDDVAVYRTVPDPSARGRARDVAARGADWILFTSPSTVAGFVDLFEADDLSRLQRDVSVAAIGPVTAAAAQDHGFSVRACAAKHTAEGLIDALVGEVAARA